MRWHSRRAGAHRQPSTPPATASGRARYFQLQLDGAGTLSPFFGGCPASSDLSYLGAVRSIPGYSVMGLAKASLEANVRFLAADLGVQGVRVNAISAGPIKTLAAAGIPGFRKMLAHVAATAPIQRNVTIDDVGNAAAFLCSDLAAGISGEVLYVDGGYRSVGMSFPGDADGA
jgi:enoyl-[acyl-carrier-protein] reductase (NADH)